MIPPSQIRGVPPIIVSNADRRAGSMSRRGRKRQHDQAQQQRDDQRHEADQHQPIRGRAAVQLGDRARRHDQQQEGEDARLDRERPERDLLVAEHAGDAHHAAVEDRRRRRAKAGWRRGCARRLRFRSHGARRNGFAAHAQPPLTAARARRLATPPVTSSTRHRGDRRRDRRRHRDLRRCVHRGARPAEGRRCSC